MDKFYNDFAKKYIRVYNEKTHPIYLLTSENYANKIDKCKTFQIAYNNFHGKFNKEDDIDFILYAYIRKNTNKFFTEEEKEFISKNINDFSNINNFNENIFELKAKLDLLTSKYMLIGERILTIDTEISKNNALKYTIQDKYHSINYNITYNGRNLINDDALYIFNSTEVSKNIPIIIYTNNKGKKYTKILKDANINDDFINEKIPNNTVAFFVNKQMIIINTDTSNCVININIDKDETNVKNLINTFFPFNTLFTYLLFTIVNKQDKIIGTISFDTEFNSYELYNIILSDPYMSFFFNIEENTTPWASRLLKYTIGFRDYNESILVSSNYTRTYMQEFSNYSYMSDVIINVPVNKNEREIGLTFLFTANNEFEVNNFAYRFSKLFSKYVKNNSPQKISPEKSSGSLLRETKFKIYTKSSDELKNKAPEIFYHQKKTKGEERIVQNGKFYFTKCQNEMQPLMIEENEIEDWKLYDRIVAEFPPANIPVEKRYYFVCPFDEFKYVYLQENEQTDDKSNSKFPFLPCCQKTKVIYNELPNYINFANGIVNLNITKSIRSIISDAILNKNSIGEVDDVLSSFLNQGFKKDDKKNFKRFGVSDIQSDPNSFINAICFAYTGNYIDSMKIRRILAGLEPNFNTGLYININIYKQELYDYDDDKIISDLLDPELFIDPYLFYRGLEELFNINIYTFAKIQDLKTSYPISFDQKNAIYPVLEIPRCRYMNIRRDNNLPTICIYKSYGNSKTKNNIPNCELIFYNIDKQKIFYSIDKDFNKYLYNYYQQVIHPISFEKNIYSNEIGCYDDPFDTNWLDIISPSLGPILGQEIDGYGKTISLIFQKWTIGIPQTQPFNLPILTRPILLDICEVHQDFILDNSIIEDDYVWIPYNGNPRGIKIYYNNNIQKKDWDISNSIEQMINDKNKTSLLMQIISYLWRSDSSPNFEEWIINNSRIDDPIIFENVPMPKISCNNRMFPIGNTFNERINKIASWWPFFFYRSKIHLSEGLFKRILNYFKREEILTKGLDNKITEPRKFVTDLIFTKTDFNSYNDIIFDNNDTLKDWLSFTQNKKYTNKSLNNMNIIYKNIDLKFKNFREPFLFKNNYGKIYIMQNIIKKYQIPHLPALQLAYYWKNNNKNLGEDYFDNDVTKYDNEKYVIYTIYENEIIVLKDLSNGSTDYFELLLYGGNRYAAMLPIL